MEQPQQNPAMSPAVQAAISRRSASQPGNLQQGQGALSQVSLQAPMQSQAPQPSPASDINKSSAPQIAPTQKWQPNDQEDFIVSSLVEQLKNSGKLKKEMMQLNQPTPQPSMGTLPVAQTQPQPPQPAPNPGMTQAPQMGMGGGGMSDPNFLKPMNSQSSSSTAFDFNTPSMATSQKQNPFSF
jgi:hypothetical protein